MERAYPEAFLKKVPVEAMRIEPGDLNHQFSVFLWVKDIAGDFDLKAVQAGKKQRPTSGIAVDTKDGRMVLATPRGLQWANDGDWVIKGPGDIFYARKDESFKRVYEPAN